MLFQLAVHFFANPVKFYLHVRLGKAGNFADVLN